MSNIARGKRIEEPVRMPGVVTDGNLTTYDDYTGFTSFEWPGTLTFDLEEETQVQCVRFLLWDGLGKPGSKRHNRRYKYRFLVSVDHKNWTVVHDNSDSGNNGWQQFMFLNGFRMRYVRIHGLSNSANEIFHIIEFEVHDEKPPELNAEIVLEKYFSPDNALTEIGDGYPIETQMRVVVGEIEKLVANSPYLRLEPFVPLIAQLRRQVRDVGDLDRSMGAIRREIIDPVADKLNESNRIGKWSIRMGWIGGVLGIISIVLSIVSLYYTIKGCP